MVRANGSGRERVIELVWSVVYLKKEHILVVDTCSFPVVVSVFIKINSFKLKTNLRLPTFLKILPEFHNTFLSFHQSLVQTRTTTK